MKFEIEFNRDFEKFDGMTDLEVLQEMLKAAVSMMNFPASENYSKIIDVNGHCFGEYKFTK